MNKILVECQLFNGLNPDEINDLLSSITYQTRKFTKDELIAQAGSEAQGLYILLRGSVRGEMVDFSGKVIKIEDIEVPRMLAPAFLFGKNNRYPVDILANNDAELIFFHSSTFLRILQLNQRVLMNYLNIISDRAQFLSAKIKFLSFHSIKGKFANYLFSLKRHNMENDILLPLSQLKLADLFGVTRPALGRIIRELHNDKIIEAKGKRIVILDKSRLIQLMK